MYSSVFFVLALFAYAADAVAHFENGDVRLQNGSTPYTGRVEVYRNATWNTVKYDSTLNQKGVAQTICTQLGYGAQLKYQPVGFFNISPAADNVTQITNVHCPWHNNPLVSEQHILRCSYDHVSHYPPPHKSDMAVTCAAKPNSTYYYDTQVRLVQRNSSAGFQSSSGFLEVYLNKAWGPVCNMNGYDVDTACRQIGYTGSASSGHSDLKGYQGKLSDKLSSFHCSNHSNACLKSCFNYPTADATFNCPNHTHITCTFDEDEALSLTSGSTLVCSNIFPILILAVSIGGGVLFLLVVAMLMCCCCCCIVSRRKKRKGYVTVN